MANDQDRQNLDALSSQMVKWSNPPKVSNLKSDLNAAQPSHQAQVNRIDAYLREFDLDYNENEQRNTNKKKKTKSEFKSRLIRKQAEWRYPSLSEPFLNTPDVFTIKPKTFDDVERAKQNELILNMQFNHEIDKVALIDEIVRTLVDEGLVILRTGWLYEEASETILKPVYSYQESDSELELAKIRRLAGIKEQDPAAFDSLPEQVRTAFELSIQQGKVIVAVDTGEKVEETKTTVIANRPSIEVCDYRDTIIDPSCKGDMDKAKFVIYEFRTSKSDLLKSGIEYKNLDKVDFEHTTAGGSDINTSSSYEQDEDVSDFNFTDVARKQVTAYEYWGYWDIDNSGIAVPIVATFIGDIMIRLERNMFAHQKIPFDVIKMMPRRKSVYGDPDGALIKDNQDVIGAIMRAAIDTMASAAAGQKGYLANALSPLNKARMERGEHYEVNPNISDVRNAVYATQVPELPASIYNMLNLQNQDAEGYTGVKAFSQGINGDALGSSVGGIRSAIDAAGKRELSILRRMTQGLKSVAKKIISMNNQFLDEDYIVRITNEEFVQVDTSDIGGTFDLEIDISTIEADNEKAAELAFMLQTLGNNAPFEFTQMILVDIAELRKMPALAKRLREYKPEPNPMEQRMAELEMSLKEAEVADKRASAIEREAAAIEKRASAQKKLSEAGKVDLDAIEQETGTSHLREIEKQQAQAEGNMALEVVKQNLNNNPVANN
jgi:hypothetical protein